MEAVQSGRDVISLYLAISDGSCDAKDCMTNELVEALQSVIYALDDRWNESRRKPSALILGDNAFYETARGDNFIRLASYGTADLFGITPATRASGSMAQLVSDTRDLEILRERLAKMPVRTVMAYERFLNALLEIPASVCMEWAAPNGEQKSAELNVQQVQRSCAFINEVTITEVSIHVKGSLTAMNLAKRTFHMESEDGHSYKGRLSNGVLQQYGRKDNFLVLPVKAEAVIERRTTFQASMNTESFIDILLEFDTNVGIDIRETLYSLKALYGRLDTFVERDSDFVSSPGISIADFTELTEMIAALVCSHPMKGARRVLDPADVAEAHNLLAAGRPICKLVKFRTQMLPANDDFADEYNLSSTVYSVQRKESDKLAKQFAAAYPDIEKLLKRMLKMINALEAAAI
ncbi:hypothetical protein ACFQZT_04355 [Paenibacillus sp. GCM10027628]|uniref:hypothetical protein n=1 Tax=Paenibacillus sp. GCM10027628 TaxID=3273413 RepID=UPI003644AC99